MAVASRKSSILNTLRGVLIADLLLAGAVVMLAVFIFFDRRDQIDRNQRLAAQGAQAHAAICTLRHDYEQRLLASQSFLREYPNGLPGIPASLIRASISQGKATIDALVILSCP